MTFTKLPPVIPDKDVTANFFFSSDSTGKKPTDRLLICITKMKMYMQQNASANIEDATNKSVELPPSAGQINFRKRKYGLPEREKSKSVMSCNFSEKILDKIEQIRDEPYMEIPQFKVVVKKAKEWDDNRS